MNITPVEQPKKKVGIGGFVLFARVRESTTRKAQAPTTYLEDGTPVQDHVILEPLTLTIEGEVGDMYVERSPIIQKLQQKAKIIGQASQYLPARTASQVQNLAAAGFGIASKVDEVQAVGNLGQSIFANGISDLTNQEKFWKHIKQIHETKSLVAIDMADETYTGMLITELSATTDAASPAVKFNLTAQKIRTAKIKLKKTPTDSVKGQAGDSVNQGAQSGKEVKDRSILSTVGGLF